LVGGLDGASIQVFGRDWVLSLNLPFSWVVVYLGAVCFTAATSLYAFWCPRIVKDYGTHDHFPLEGGSVEQLKHYLSRTFGVPPITPSDREFARNFVNEFAHGTSASGLEDPIEYIRGDRPTIAADRIPDAFWRVWAFADRRAVIARALCFVFHILGFVAVAIVLAQNFVAVLG
jgi:hypothetical protein